MKEWHCNKCGRKIEEGQCRVSVRMDFEAVGQHGDIEESSYISTPSLCMDCAGVILDEIWIGENVFIMPELKQFKVYQN